MPVQIPQWTEYLSCPICFNKYNDLIHVPLTLSCGHTLCKTCLSKLHQNKCPFDQTAIGRSADDLPPNNVIIRLVNGRPPEFKKLPKLIGDKNVDLFESCMSLIEELAMYLKPVTQPLQDLNVNIPSSGNSTSSATCSSVLSRPMQRKLVALINCQLIEDEGRSRAMRGARSLGERTVTELILHHQNPHQLSANLWAAVRARGCQFLGPAMQEEVLKLILLALEDGSALSRKVLVLFVVQRLEAQYPQASKTAIGHVVQLLYRASCFKVTKRDEESSLMQLKEEFRNYESLRREHDSQVVQIATEAGLRIAPEQWSSLLYGDTSHKSHMQSIIDKLQTPQSFSQSVSELVIALQRTGDPGNLSRLRPHLDLLANIDPTPDTPPPSWDNLNAIISGTHTVIKGLIEFVQNHSFKKYDAPTMHSAKYKTSMCRDYIQKNSCPRGAICTFAHSDDEMEKYRAKSKRIAKTGFTKSLSSDGDLIIANQQPAPVGLVHQTAADSLTVTASNGTSTVTALATPVNMSATVNSNTTVTPYTPSIRNNLPITAPAHHHYNHNSANHRSVRVPIYNVMSPQTRPLLTAGVTHKYRPPTRYYSSGIYEEYPPTSGPPRVNIGSGGILQDLYQRRSELLAQLHHRVPSVTPGVASSSGSMTHRELARSVSDTAGTMHVTSTLAQHNNTNKNYPRTTTTGKTKTLKTSSSSSNSSSYTAWSTGDDSELLRCEGDIQTLPVVSDDDIWDNTFQTPVSLDSDDDESYVPFGYNDGDDDDDDLIPFDPVPRVSKYGPISRTARSRIRNTAPVMATASIQEVATTPVTALTPLSHPYQTVSWIPSIYTHRNDTSEPLAIHSKIHDSEPASLWKQRSDTSRRMMYEECDHVMHELERVDQQIRIIAEDEQLVKDIQALNIPGPRSQAFNIPGSGSQALYRN
ncbi:uncharacterized protein LOC141909054 [Tubulanus polymorphus]|uniref:uncharacterized protein LOC141909054 n=1 Tax=Tubulanus polymorphus TaxID=672921 RepID=UPI003DA581D4